MAWQDFPLVLVTWRDAHADAQGWASVDELDDEPCIVHSVGFHLENRKPGHVTIVQSIIVDELDSALHIPTAMVDSIRTLEIDHGSLISPSAPHRELPKAGKSPRVRGTRPTRPADPTARAEGSLTKEN